MKKYLISTRLSIEDKKLLDGMVTKSGISQNEFVTRLIRGASNDNRYSISKEEQIAEIVVARVCERLINYLSDSSVVITSDTSRQLAEKSPEVLPEETVIDNSVLDDFESFFS